MYTTLTMNASSEASLHSCTFTSENVPGDVEEEQTLQLQVLNFGCQVCPVTLMRKKKAKEDQGFIKNCTALGVLHDSHELQRNKKHGINLKLFGIHNREEGQGGSESAVILKSVTRC